jgi:hypothetical protein
MINFENLSEVKIEVFLPPEAIEAVRQALTAEKAGIIGNYDNTYATTEVTGHWRPLENASPYIGTIGEIETAREIKLEVNCQVKYVSAVLKAIRSAHPYEEPLINVLPVINSLFE